MRKFYLAIIYLTGTSALLVAQNRFPGDYDPNTHLHFIPCPYNSADSVWMYDGFEVFYTLDDLPSGIIDSTQCIDFGKFENQHFRISGDDIEAERPLFIEWENSDSNSGFTFLSHNVATFITSLQGTAMTLDTGMCPYGPCTQSSFEVLHEVAPDSFQTSTIDLAFSYVSSSYYQLNNECWPTRKFANSEVLRFKSSLLPSGSGDIRVNAYVDSWYDLYLMDSIYFENARVSDTVFDFTESYYWANLLFAHLDDSIPSSQNIYYHQFSPEPNTDSSQHLTVHFGEQNHVIFEPFVNIQGGMPLLDSIRHTVEVINNGSDFCFAPFVELMFFSHSGFTHQKGSIYPEGNACFMFRNGSQLKISKGASFYYGQDGDGILALNNGSQLIMEPESKLIFGSNLIFMNKDKLSPSDYQTILPRGTHIQFLPGAKITTQFSGKENFKWKILMHGGTIDLSALSSDDQLEIELVYPATTNDLGKDLVVIGNPISDVLNFTFAASQSEVLNLQILNASGGFLMSKEFYCVPGLNELEVDLFELPASPYLMHFSGNTSTVYKTLIKL
jgi:hypothetical protein